MTAVSMVVIAGILAALNGDVEKALPSILTVFLLAGVMQIGLGLLGLGKVYKIHTIPSSVRFYDSYWSYYFSNSNITCSWILSQRRSGFC